jgi:uncharacterized protein (DUF1778 family)
MKVFRATEDGMEKVRDVIVSTRFTTEQVALVRAAAAASGQKPATWARAVLVAEAAKRLAAAG